MNEKKSAARYAYVILFLVCLGIFIPDFSQYQISGFGAQLTESMGLTSSQFAQIATAPLIPGIFLSLVVGIIVDRFGARRPLTVAMVISGAAIVWRLFARSYAEIYISMICMGVCATFLNANNAKILSQWFSPARAGIMVGFYLGAANAANALGQGTTAFFPSVQSAFRFSAVLAVVGIALFVIFMRDHDSTQKEIEHISVLEGLKVCSRNRYIWIIALCLMLDVSAYSSLAHFLPQALATRGIPQTTAPLISMGLSLGGLASCFIGPALITRARNTRLVITCCAAAAALGVAFAWRASMSPVVLFILVFLTGFLSTSFTPVITALPVRLEKIGTKYAGTAGGMIATVQLAGIVILPTYVISPIVGSNFKLMFLIFGALDVILCVVVQFLPKLGRTDK